MKTLLLLLALFAFSTVNAQDLIRTETALKAPITTQREPKYKITRYEQKSDALFICINHTKKPVYIEHFFTETERKDSVSISDKIEELVAELMIKADEYVAPEAFVSRIDKAEKFKQDSVKVKAKKVVILEKRRIEKINEAAKQDSIKRLEVNNQVEPLVK